MNDYESAIADLEKAIERNPTVLFIRTWLAAAYAQAGRIEDAEWEVEEMMAMGFQSTLSNIIETGYVRHPPFKELYAEGLRKAGLPE